MQIVYNFFVSTLFFLCALTVSAQVTYNQVTLDRGKDLETNCIYVLNDNADSVRVVVQYKIGNRNTNWIDYPVPELIPPSIEPLKIGCIDSTIIGLRLVDVVIVRERSSLKDTTTRSKLDSKSFFYKLIKKLFK